MYACYMNRKTSQAGVQDGFQLIDISSTTGAREAERNLLHIPSPNEPDKLPMNGWASTEDGSLDSRISQENDIRW